MRRRQSGVSLFVVAIVLILAAGAIFALTSLFRTRLAGAGSTQAIAAFANLQTALEQYAGSTGRLPCPANPALDTGVASPAVATSTCDFPAGTIPWSTIGARRDDAYDPWGFKISYRVYTGAAGPLTQDNGASMVQCDTSTTRSPGMLATGRCYQAFGRHTASTEFLAGKGLAVTDFGTAVTGVAYVLVSHGSSGLGAWASGGLQRDAPANVAELANTTATGPFTAQAAADETSPTSTAHFDDLVTYRTIEELARRANLAARDWPDTAATTENVVLNSATVSESTGTTAPAGDVGRQTLVLANSTITAFDSGGNQNLSLQAVAGSDGVGGVTGGDGIGSQNSEGLRIKLDAKARKLGFALNDFVTSPAAYPFWKARAQVKFIDSATSTNLTVTAQQCRSGSGLASFASLDAGFDFDTIEITATSSSPDPFFGSQLPSGFFLSAFTTCSSAAASCSSSLETAGNLCP